MPGHGFNHKASDRLLKMPGKLDRGPVEFDSRVAPHLGEIMEIATTNVVSVPPTMAIIGAAQTMTTCGFRRLPVTDPGYPRRLLEAWDAPPLLFSSVPSHGPQAKEATNSCRAWPIVTA